MLRSLVRYFLLIAWFLCIPVIWSNTIYFGGQKINLEEVPAKQLVLERSEGQYPVRDTSRLLHDDRDTPLRVSEEERVISEDEYISSAYSFGGPEELYVMNRFFVSADEPGLGKILKSEEARILRAYEWTDMYLVELVSARHSSEVLEFISDLLLKEQVNWAHPDLLYPKQTRYIPNDPLFPDQWHLSSDQSFRHIHAPGAWSVSTGDNDITIAVIDDGIDVNHPEFAGKLVFGRNVVNGTDDPSHTSSQGYHGTSCAGLAAAQGDNAVGVAGVAFDSKIMPVYLIDSNMTIAHEVEAFEWAVQNGADVISNSWGPPDGVWQNYTLPDAVGQAIQYAVYEGREGKGIPVFWAAGNGNERTDLDGYASNPLVINVGASNFLGTRSSYSDFGETLDIVAPSSGEGYGLVTTDRDGGYRNNFGGTSASAPIAAGVAALVLSEAEHLSWRGVKAILQHSADKIDIEKGLYNEHGFSPWYGYGKVNAASALELAARPSLEPPAIIDDLEFFVRDSKAFLQWTAPGCDGNDGQALYYELRWSSQEITGDNFEQAHRYQDFFLPGPAGTVQKLHVDGIPTDTELFFALKTYDNRENASDITLACGVVPSREEKILIYSFDFETSEEGWYGEAPWERVLHDDDSTGYVWMDSPEGNYANNLNISLCSPLLDLSLVQYVQVSIDHKYFIEERWDVGFLEVSTDGGDFWYPAIHGFTGAKSSFTVSTFYLPYTDESSDVKIRFRLNTDASITDKGWSINRVLIYGVPMEGYVPSIIISDYQQAPQYPTDEEEVEVELRACHPDGIETALIYIRYDEGEFTPFSMDPVGGEDSCGWYRYLIPPAADGTDVQYYFYFATTPVIGQERYYPSQAPADYFTYSVYAPQIWYVSTEGSDDNAGSAWDQAFLSVQAALDSASDFDQVWVQHGTYNGGFSIPPQVSVNGGFQGNEISLADRNVSLDETIITGNNQVRVVTNYGLLDGFIVTNGQADNGGGIYNHPGGHVHNCRIHSNTAGNLGGGIFNQGRVTESVIFNNSAIHGGGIDNYSVVERCRVYDNTASQHGGGMYNDRGQVSASLIYNNQAGGYGGGISNDGTVINAVVYGNSAENGGGMDNYGGEVFNCTIADNTAANRGGGLFNDIPMGGNASVVNSVIWNNVIGSQSQNYYSNNVNATISYSIFSEADGNNNNISQDPLFVSGANQDYQLTKYSPGIDSGNAELAPDADYYGVLRPQGSNVDRGAFEYEHIVPSRPENIFPVSDSLRPEYVELRSSVFQSESLRAGHRASSWQVALDNGFEDIVRESGMTQDALTFIKVIPHLDEGKTYYWRVRHQDTFLAESPWSYPTSFQVDERTDVSPFIYHLYK